MYEGTNLGGRAGKVPLGVLAFLVVVAIAAIIAVARVGGGDPSSGSTDDTAPSLDQLAPKSPLVDVANQLAQLIDSSRLAAEEIPELTSDISAGEARLIREQWAAFSQHLAERVDAIEALLPEPPAEDAENEVKRGYERLPRAIEVLRELSQPADGTAVPTMLMRTSRLEIARNHVASAQRYFFRVGL